MQAEKNRLWKVWTASNVCHTGIEAPDAYHAMAMVAKGDDAKLKKIWKVTSEPIYSASIGVECNGEKLSSEDAMFEINLRGTDPAVLEKVKKAIAIAIGCPMLDGDSNPKYLLNMLDGDELDLCIISL